MRRFINGGLFVICLHGLVTDFVGLERWVEIERAHWINLPWWVWLFPIWVLWFREQLAERDDQVKTAYFNRQSDEEFYGKVKK